MSRGRRQFEGARNGTASPIATSLIEAPLPRLRPPRLHTIGDESVTFLYAFNLDAVRPAAGRPALPARRGRPLRQPHPPAAGRGGGARPAEPPPPPADPPPVGRQGRDAVPPRRVPTRALPLRRRARAARARAWADHRAPAGTVLLLLRGAPR